MVKAPFPKSARFVETFRGQQYFLCTPDWYRTRGLEFTEKCALLLDGNIHFHRPV